MDRRHEIENLRRSIAMLPPGHRDGLDRERALRLLGQLVKAQDETERLQTRPRELAEE